MPRASGVVAGAGLLAAALAALATAPARAQDSPPADAEQQFHAIAQCLGDGKEIVMAPRLRCVRRQTGADIAEDAGMPLREGDWGAVCRNEADARRLPRDIVKRLVKEAQVAPSGIRIIGAVFCDGVDLAGADLGYSLVLDRAVFVGVVDARNARIKGDFSFEYSLILSTLRLNRARVEGTVYGGASFMKRLRAFDTQVNGSWQQTNSIIFYDAQIVRLSISGDLNLNGSAVGRLWLQTSHVNGTFELDDSEARCAYHVNASTVGYLTANNAGFGIVKAAPPGADGVDYTWWDRTRRKAYTRAMFESPAIKKIADAEEERIGRRIPGVPADSRLIPGCREDRTRKDGSEVVEGVEGYGGSEFAEFYVFDTKVEAAFCLTSFAWLEPKQALPDEAQWISILALNGTSIAGNFVVDLWGDGKSNLGALQPGNPDFDRVRYKHKFEAIGLSATALIYDFSDNTRPYFTYIDGLKFDRVHKAKPNCTNDSGTKLASQPELPNVNDVIAWLELNEAPSSQPFLAFVQAFENAGESATRLRIRRKSLDVCDRVLRWVPFAEPICPGRKAADRPTGDTQPRTVAASVGNVISNVADLIATGFQVILWLVADHGMRPGKVVWPVIITLVAFWALFRWRLRIVGFDPKAAAAQPPGRRPPWAIGFLFLFDRLIPIYKLREEHYGVARYYRVAEKDELAAPDAARPPCPMSYFGRKLIVCPVDEAGYEAVERWLVFLRIIGAVLSVFLVAAIGALTR